MSREARASPTADAPILNSVLDVICLFPVSFFLIRTVAADEVNTSVFKESVLH